MCRFGLNFPLTPLLQVPFNFTFILFFIFRFKQLLYKFPFQNVVEKLEGFGDSDWAGDKSWMKSTSGGAVFLGQSMLKSWGYEATQDNVRL